ncbi:MAG: glucokinase [Natrialbaceae archaeon]|jgi:glucokinase
MGYSAGIDLGATHVRAVVAETTTKRILDGNDPIVVGRDRRSTPQGPTGDRVTAGVLDCLRDACGAAGIDPTDLEAVGVGSIGPLDRDAGAAVRPPNLSGDVGRVILVDPIADLTGLSATESVVLHNDTIAAITGERELVPDTPENAAYLTISSGIGAGVCVDGQILSGWNGNAGEVGHVTVDSNGRLTCGCGKDGHWEAYCSGENLPDFARLLHHEEPTETALPLSDEEFAAPDVFDHAPEDDFAARVVDRMADLNALGVATIVHAYAPGVVSIGGSVALENEALVIDAIRDRLEAHVITNVPEIRPTPLGQDVVVKGALASAVSGTGQPSSDGTS